MTSDEEQNARMNKIISDELKTIQYLRNIQDTDGDVLVYISDVIRFIRLMKKVDTTTRQDERKQLKEPTSIGSCRVCGMDDAVLKERERMTNIITKLKENMELGGYALGWETKDKSEYRQGQFSVYEWLLKELR